MRKLNSEELLSINGGDKTWYEKVRDFVNDNLGELVRGIKDGWNSKQDKLHKYNMPDYICVIWH